MMITREEFGLDLFEAVKCIGGLLAIQDQINASVHQEKPLDDLIKKREALKLRLIPLMQTLDARDVTEILERYPMVKML